MPTFIRKNIVVCTVTFTAVNGEPDSTFCCYTGAYVQEPNRGNADHVFEDDI